MGFFFYFLTNFYVKLALYGLFLYIYKLLNEKQSFTDNIFIQENFKNSYIEILLISTI